MANACPCVGDLVPPPSAGFARDNCLSALVLRVSSTEIMFPICLLRWPQRGSNIPTTNTARPTAEPLTRFCVLSGRSPRGPAPWARPPLLRSLPLPPLYSHPHPTLPIRLPSTPRDVSAFTFIFHRRPATVTIPTYEKFDSHTRAELSTAISYSVTTVISSQFPLSPPPTSRFRLSHLPVFSLRPS